MTAIILPFRQARRRRFVLNQAASVACRSPSEGEEYLARHIRIQAETLARKGVAPELIAIEMRSLECAIRAELWRMVLTPGGAA